MKKLVAICSMNPNFQYCKKSYEQLCYSFSYISATPVPQNHGSPSESYLSEDSKLDSSPNTSLLYYQTPK